MMIKKKSHKTIPPSSIKRPKYHLKPSLVNIPSNSSCVSLTRSFKAANKSLVKPAIQQLTPNKKPIKEDKASANENIFNTK